MADPLPLDEENFSRLAAIRDLGLDSLRNLVDSLRSVGARPLRFGELAQLISSCLPDKGPAVHAIMQQIVSLHAWVRQGGYELEDVLDGLRASVRAHSHRTPKEYSEWDSINSIFEELIRSPVIRLSVAANDLSYEHANLLQRARILTEIRPVYDSEATEIQAAVISHTLRLVFQSIDGPHELTLALDEIDVENIAEQCERAMRKSAVAKELMNNRANIPSIVSGGTSDE